MKININIRANIDVDITDDIVYEVNNSYNGNFERWIENNFQEYIEDNEFDLHNVKYSREEGKEEIKKIIKKISEQGDYFLIRSHNKELLKNIFPENCLPPMDEMKQINVDLELMENVIGFTDFFNSKVEFNYIHLSGEYVEATNGKILIKHKHKYNFENKKLLFPTYFIEPMKNGAECYIWKENSLYLKYKNEWFQGLYYYRNFVFPDVSKLLSKEDFLETCPYIEDKNNIEIKETENESGVVVHLKIKNVIYELNKVYYDKIALFDYKIVGCYSNECVLPMFFKGDDFEIVAMPISVGLTYIYK
jgi:hypothetical protein